MLDAREPGEVRMTDPWPADLPWPGKLPEHFGFAPHALTHARRLIKELATALIGERPDKADLHAKLVQTLQIDVNDFVRRNQSDARERRAAVP